MKAKAIACIACVLLLSNAQGTQQPCSPALLPEGRAGVCIYHIGKKPLFVSVRVVMDGDVRGKLTRQQPWLWIDAAPGAHIVGIDLGKTPQARRRIDAAAGEIRYLRYERVTQTVTGFFDTSTTVQAELREVPQSDAAGDLDQLTARVSRQSRR